MKKEKLRHYANVLSSHADHYWVTPLFFLLFFLDSFLIVIPVDSLLAATITLRPQNKKKWLITSIVGFGLGLAMVAILANSKLQPWLLGVFDKWGYIHHVEQVIEHAANYGYLELALGVFTVIPPLFGVIAGVIVHLDPVYVWIICFAGKILKIILTVWIIFSGSQALKKWLRIYLKTSV